MLDFPLWKRIWLWGITLAVALVSVPSITSLSGVSLPDWAEGPEINLGLDLAGGSHILLEADPSQVASQRLESLEDSVRTSLRDAEPAIRIGDVSTSGGRLSFMLDNPAEIDRAREILTPLINGNGLVREWDMQLVDGNRMILTPTEQGLDQAVDDAMESATDVVRRRIDDLGTREPTIIRQGDDRIVVQVPGLEDPQALKDLLGQTARLEFKLVAANRQAEITEAEARANPLPGTEWVPFAEEEGLPGLGMVVNRLGGIRGDSLTGAQQGFRQEDNLPVVNIQFDAQGGAIFARLSTENTGRRFAIILDDEVISAPSFNEPILSGAAQISGSFTVETANQLAITLRSGALPVDLTIIEERTVGPDLGRDSIVAGAVAMGIGSVLVVLLMVATYGRFGIYSTFALVFNILMVLGIMAIMNTTLTLPGIAGFVLTVGAAVDANVLINERIREERRRGRRVVAAVENGYKEASRAIYDANVTNFIAGVLLFLFGSGPVRGFAVVLIIGLFTSVFTAVVLTRMWVAGWLRDKRPQDINI
ncbi:protein translocase subunit SecD [Aurantiacibacter gangjinensis]|uniref:Protein translocase subunit SecD n=1 Tax=Aurantiacibacter gangjinensis TaxID=502682 RepID=A0A0G9MR03_9SPHN|nr:protein translocase subunit SecD [Aurantiacibacter gangjinensis]APE29065.1 Protein-export membrane protein SecD [Aurantiacibacter gangjinensis]KLE33156.1 preprotein translocase subunit SecD [Aurantiacibacter gangjinensis]